MNGPVEPQQGDIRRSTRRRLLAPLLVLILLVLVLVVLHRLGLTKYVTTENIEKLTAWVKSTGAWGPLAYIVVCALGVVLLSPAMPWLLVAGIFGSGFGTLYASVGLTLGAAACFLLARYAFRPGVERLIERHPGLRRLDEGVRKQGWRMVMITRLVPVFPFNLQNYVYGITGIGFVTYVVVSWVCMMPAITAYVFAGGALISGQGHIGKTLGYIAVGAVLLVLLSFVPQLVRRFWGPKFPPDET